MNLVEATILSLQGKLLKENEEKIEEAASAKPELIQACARLNIPEADREDFINYLYSLKGSQKAIYIPARIRKALDLSNYESYVYVTWLLKNPNLLLAFYADWRSGGNKGYQTRLDKDRIEKKANKEKSNINKEEPDKNIAEPEIEEEPENIEAEDDIETEDDSFISDYVINMAKKLWQASPIKDKLSKQAKEAGNATTFKNQLLAKGNAEIFNSNIGDDLAIVLFNQAINYKK